MTQAALPGLIDRLYCTSCGREHLPANTVYCRCGKVYEMELREEGWRVVDSRWGDDETFPTEVFVEGESSLAE